MRCERGSVGVVLPASSRFKPSRTEDTGMRIIGLDIHRAFAEAVVWKDGKLSRLGRIIMRREPLEEFANQLSSSDVVVIEATGNAASVAAVIGPHVSRVVIANPKQVRPHCAREDQNRQDRRRRTGAALRQRLFAGGLD